MRTAVTFVLFITCGFALPATVTTAAKTSTAKKAATSTSTTSTKTSASSSKGSAAKSTSHLTVSHAPSNSKAYAKRGKYSHASRGPAVQAAPSPERYQEIQKALADRGFFQGEVDGKWGADSVDALKRYQAAQNLPDDGKINSLSLIGLGLGPNRVYPNGIPPAAHQQQAAPQAPGTTNPQGTANPTTPPQFLGAPQSTTTPATTPPPPNQPSQP